MINRILKTAFAGSLLMSAAFGQILTRPGNRDIYTRPQEPYGGRAIERPSDGDLDLVDADALRGIQVTPSLNGVVFRFFARLNAAPTIEVDRRAPATDASGRPSFGGNAEIVFNPVAIMTQTSEPGKEYIGGTHQVNATLKPGVTYNYVISVPKGNPGREYRQSGTFRTAKRTVKVVFTRIRLVGESDEGDLGNSAHRSFLFVVNPREASEQWRFWSNVDIGAGDIRRLEQTISPMMIANAPDRIRVMVEGRDLYTFNNCNVSMEPIDGSNSSIPQYGMNGANYGCRILNYAKAEFDISRFTSETSIPFTIVANADLSKRIVLAFDISGYITVTFE